MSNESWCERMGSAPGSLGHVSARGDFIALYEKGAKRFALPLFIIGALVEGRQLVEEAACGALGLKNLAACGALGVKKQLAALGG